MTRPATTGGKRRYSERIAARAYPDMVGMSDDDIGNMWITRRWRMRKLFDEFIEVHELVARSDARQERSDQLLDTIRRIAALPFDIDMDE